MKLSIITVNLNNANGLRKTIESVVSQTFTDFEYIVIDGGSTDGGVDIIKQYADKITYWVSEPDKGIYNAMNKGILRAKGEYCYFLNSGDYLVDENVLKIIFSRDSICGFINGNRIMFGSEKGKSVVDKGVAFKTKGNVTLRNMLEDNLRHQSTFIKRELFEKYGLYDENYIIVSDWILFLRAIGLDGERVEYMDVNIAYFDTTGISRSKKSLGALERKRAIATYVPLSILRDYENFLDIESKFRSKDYDEYQNLKNGKLGIIIKLFIRLLTRLSKMMRV